MLSPPFVFVVGVRAYLLGLEVRLSLTDALFLDYFVAGMTADAVKG